MSGPIDKDRVYRLLKGLGFDGPPLNIDGLARVLEADRALATNYIEARAEKIDRHGGKASARQLRITASDISAGFHIDTLRTARDVVDGREGEG